MEGFDFFPGGSPEGSHLGVRIKELFIILSIIGVSDFSAVQEDVKWCSFASFYGATKAASTVVS